MEEKIEGYYHCHGCGAYFRAPAGAVQNCQECGISLQSPEIWDRVINRRTNGLAFEASKNLSEERIASGKIDRMADKLDIVGRKKARRRTFAIFAGIFWVLFVIGLIYKVNKKEDKLAERPQLVGDGSIPIEDYQSMLQIVKKCEANLNLLLKSEDPSLNLSLLYQPDENLLDQYYVVEQKRHPSGPVSAKIFKVNDQRAEVVFSTPQEQQLEAVFHQEDKDWKLDWKAFTNYSTMPFEDFLLNKPTESHTFRLLFTEKEYGLTLALNLVEYNRHNQKLTRVTSNQATIKLDSGHPEMDKLAAVIKASKLYQKFNSSLSERESGSLARNDPDGYYRISVKLAYVEEGDYKRLVLKEVIGAHWMGDYYENLLRPEQQLLLDRQTPGKE